MGHPDGVGGANHFQTGSIYFTPRTGAHEVRGAIRAKWASVGWERGFLGYPLSDETSVTSGRANQFQGGNVYWSPATGAYEVHGRYLQLGGTAGRLGLPVTDEYGVPGGRRSDFQHGSILWDGRSSRVSISP